MRNFISSICLFSIACIGDAQNSDSYQMHINMNDGVLHYSTERIQDVLFETKQSVDNPTTTEGQMTTDIYSAISVSGLSSDFINATESDGRSEVIVRMSGISMQAIGGATPANDAEGFPCVTAEGNVWKWNSVNWDEKCQRDIDFYYILGTGNPYTALHAEEIYTNGTATGKYRASYDYYNPNGSSELPISGLYYKFSPKFDGVLKVGIWSNKNNRNTYVVEESSRKPIKYQVDGYINGQNDSTGKKRFLTNEEISVLHDNAGVGAYVIGTGTYFWGWITFEVQAGKVYWLFQDSSQIGFQGFTFTYIATDEVEDNDMMHSYLMKIVHEMGNVTIPTDDVLEISFDKENPVSIPKENTILDEKISDIPEAYAEKALSRGQVVGLNYTTTSYVSHQQVEKTAYVYLPWEYEYYPERRYNVLYLMHGMGDDASTYIYGNTKELRMAIDHLIQDGIIEPLIVVTPTFYDPESGNANITQAAVSFPKELLNDLMPAVESKFRTYAPSADLNGFKVSRKHRAFGGFSMGSVTTWNVFAQALPYIYDFVPMSGGMTMTSGGGSVAATLADVVEQADLGEHDFFINAMSGSEDYAASGLESQINQMSSYSPFVLSRDRNQGNIYYRSLPGGLHDYKACITYVYNALFNLFR